MKLKKDLKYRLRRGILYIAIICMIYIPLIHSITYIELYSTTMKYQLKNDINKGDSEAIEYYKETYVDNNIKLFEESELNIEI